MPAPAIENDSTNYTNSGSIKLSWHSQAHDRDTAIASFELERAQDPDFKDARSYYRGPDLATYISGLSNGRYYFRIREVHGEQVLSGWSAPVEVVVEHHSLHLAFTLFGIGGLVFAATVFVVLRGARHTRDQEDEEPGVQERRET